MAMNPGLNEVALLTAGQKTAPDKSFRQSSRDWADALGAVPFLTALMQSLAVVMPPDLSQAPEQRPASRSRGAAPTLPALAVPVEGTNEPAISSVTQREVARNLPQPEAATGSPSTLFNADTITPPMPAQETRLPSENPVITPLRPGPSTGPLRQAPFDKVSTSSTQRLRTSLRRDQEGPQDATQDVASTRPDPDRASGGAPSTALRQAQDDSSGRRSGQASVAPDVVTILRRGSGQASVVPNVATPPVASDVVTTSVVPNVVATPRRGLRQAQDVAQDRLQSFPA